VADAYLRIGEVARRSGVNAELLRVWERRYGVLQPERSAGGFRLYSEQDVERVSEMRRLVAEGVSAAEAARLVDEGATATTRGPQRGDLADARQTLHTAIASFDETAAHEAFDRLVADLTPETILRDVVLPLLHEVGESWARGELSVAQEHFGTHVLRGRLLGLARGWARGVGPVALLACPPGEQHDLGLIAFGVALNRLGWRIAFLGADTPLETIESAAEAVHPSAIVLAATLRNGQADTARLLALGRERPLYLGGAAANEELAKRAGARYLGTDPVAAAEELARTARS
jgi:MerR family transcriptional regulator, light-induced transcriptional regulator